MGDDTGQRPTSVHTARMKTLMNAKDLRTVEQLREFLEGVRAVAFEVPGGKAERYGWVLVRFLYPTLSRRDKGTVVRYLVTGYSREQVFRLIRQYRKTGRLDLRPRSQGQTFTRRYTASDIRVDTVHQGDWDGQKGVYHINAVDEVTQFEVVVSVEKITWSRPWSNSWTASPSPSTTSTPTTAPNTSTGG